MCSQEDGWKQWANLKKHVMGEPFVSIGIDISGHYNVTDDGTKYILVVSDYFTRSKVGRGVSHEAYGS